MVQVNGHDQHEDRVSASHSIQVNGIKPELDEEEQEGEEEGNGLPTIYFSHTVEPKKVRCHFFNCCCFFLISRTLLDRIHCVTC